MRDFHIARADKFKKGALAHPDQTWDSIDPISELQDELLDLYNYADHRKFPPHLKETVQNFALDMWDELLK